MGQEVLILDTPSWEAVGGRNRQEELHSCLISVLLPKEMELWAAEGKGMGRGLLPPPLQQPCEPWIVTLLQRRGLAQRVDLLAKFHAARARHNLDLRPMTFHYNRQPPRR